MHMKMLLFSIRKHKYLRDYIFGITDFLTESMFFCFISNIC